MLSEPYRKLLIRDRIYFTWVILLPGMPEYILFQYNREGLFSVRNYSSNDSNKRSFDLAIRNEKPRYRALAKYRGLLLINKIFFFIPFYKIKRFLYFIVNTAADSINGGSCHHLLLNALAILWIIFINH